MPVIAAAPTVQGVSGREILHAKPS